MATVEFAIIGAVFILLLIGIMQLGLGIYYRNHVANVAREAARYAALHGSSAPTPATTSSVRNVVLARSNTLVDTSKISVTTTWIPNNDSGSVVRVRVQYPYPITIPFIPSQTLQLQSTSEMIIF